MNTFQVLETKTERLKWEPDLVVTPFKAVPQETWSNALEFVNDENLLDEMDSIIETAKEDHILFLVLAYSEDQLVGFSLINAWKGQTKSKGILIVCMKDMEDYEIAEPFTKFIARMLVERTLQETKDLKYHDTVKDLKQVFCEKNKPWIVALLKKYGYSAVEAY